MAALTPTKVVYTELAGGVKLKIFRVTPSTASDTVVLSSYFDTIYGAFAHLTAGLDADLTILQVSFSTTTVTIKQLKADGATNASEWGSAAIELWVFGSDEVNSGS